MKTYIRIVILSLFILLPFVGNSQILISLLFGEALNSPNIEFGLSGGMNRSTIYTIDDAEPMNNFDLGFYFHILLKNNSYLSTGVHVKSQVGATGMPTYSMGDPEFDEVYKDATLTKKIPAFYVPILFQQRFAKRWYIELGPQLGLIYKPKDTFDRSAFDGELTYTRDVKDEYKHIDAGMLGGIGYKFKKEIKSMAVGVNYYYGLTDISKNPDQSIKNSAVYFYIKIPIGLGKKKEES
ncbi:porin family protein [Carboxylicivirga sp. N1Y90]|uniref:porin family protein n=1 Tax=Carboxylicivirga fragile TaxID=3417571 RepID=UPI003D3556F2|nr:PorT family protein [Marinilabiliaceae bacterium N1Y90]